MKIWIPVLDQVGTTSANGNFPLRTYHSGIHQSQFRRKKFLILSHHLGKEFASLLATCVSIDLIQTVHHRLLYMKTVDDYRLWNSRCSLCHLSIWCLYSQCIFLTYLAPHIISGIDERWEIITIIPAHHGLCTGTVGDSYLCPALQIVGKTIEHQFILAQINRIGQLYLREIACIYPALHHKKLIGRGLHMIITTAQQTAVQHDENLQAAH